MFIMIRMLDVRKVLSYLFFLMLHLSAVHADPGRLSLFGQLLSQMRQHVTISVLSLATTGFVLTWLITQPKSKLYIKRIVSSFGSRRKRLNGIKIVYGSETEAAQKYAVILDEEARIQNLKSSMVNIRDYDAEDCLSQEINNGILIVFIIATCNDGIPPDDTVWFHKWLLEGANDSRLPRNMLEGLEYTVLGIGNSQYQEDFCEVAMTIDTSLEILGANHRLLPVGILDENISEISGGGQEKDFMAWKKEFWQAAIELFTAQSEGKKKSCQCSKPTCCTETGKSENNLASDREDSGREEIKDIEDLVGDFRGRRVPGQHKVKAKTIKLS